jgi:hypothetical protein
MFATSEQVGLGGSFASTTTRRTGRKDPKLASARTILANEARKRKLEQALSRNSSNAGANASQQLGIVKRRVNESQPVEKEVGDDSIVPKPPTALASLMDYASSSEDD